MSLDQALRDAYEDFQRNDKWDDPQLSDGDMPQEDKSYLAQDLNDYLRMLADMDTIDLSRKLYLLEDYIQIVKSRM